MIVGPERILGEVRAILDGALRGSRRLRRRLLVKSWLLSKVH
jgi:hypothetical protein